MLLHRGVGLLERLRLEAVEPELDGRPFGFGPGNESLHERELGGRLRGGLQGVAIERGLVDGVARRFDLAVEMALRMTSCEVVDRGEGARLLGDRELLRQRGLQGGGDLGADVRLWVILRVRLDRSDGALFHRRDELRPREQDGRNLRRVARAAPGG